MRNMLRFTATLFVTLGLVACEPTKSVDTAADTGADVTDGGTGGTDGGTTSASVSFTEVQEAVFLGSCAGAGCHDAATNAGTLDLESDGAYERLMFDPCANELAIAEGLMRVDPGNLENSFLYLKMTDPQGMGDPMPPWGPVDDEALGLIEDWILGGAMP